MKREDLTPDMLLVMHDQKRPRIVHIRRRVQCQHEDCAAHVELADACLRARMRESAPVFGQPAPTFFLAPLCGSVRRVPEWSKAARRGVTHRGYVTPHPFFAEQFLRRFCEHDDGGVPFMCGKCMESAGLFDRAPIEERVEEARGRFDEIVASEWLDEPAEESAAT